MPNETRMCQSCRNRFPRANMVRIADYQYYCAPCHVSFYVSCADCGAQLRPSYAVYDFEVDPDRNQPLCYRCLDRRSYWDVSPSDVSIATYEKVGSKRKFGVEIETASCDNYKELRGRTLFGVHTDGSISGLEFISPILYGDEGFQEIKDFCDFARDKGWTVNRECGLHIHLDMRDENNDSLMSIAAAYILSYGVWKSFVSASRAGNSYCHETPYEESEICRYEGDFYRWADNQTRFSWFNVAAYAEHQSFEIRLMKGTIDPELICNWIAAHARFCDWASSKTRSEIRAAFGGHTIANSKWTKWKSIVGPELARYFGRMRRSQAAGITA